MMRRLSLYVVLSLMFTACDLIPLKPPTPSPTPPPPETLVMVTFRVKLPQPIPVGETVYLSEVDEVTGLPFNPILHPMEAEDNQNFRVIIPIKQSSLFKYRYVRKGNYEVLESTADERPIRYRVFLAKEPGLIQDFIYRWTDTAPKGNGGRIFGKAVRLDNGQPIPNLIVTAGGMQTQTLANGTFILEGLPEGTHQLVAFAQDGTFEIFQQGATIIEGAATEAILQMQLARMVNVTFNLTIPEKTPPGASIRIAGNWLQLGNSFAALRGGTSNTAIRLPGMQRQANGSYTFTVALPVGGDIRYKYTLGDGIWNAEQNEKGELFTRQFIVPDTEFEIVDQVARWNDTDQVIVSFDVRVPTNSPKDEIVSIQFNPGFAWMEPIPMWLVEPQRWVYSLYSPLRGLEKLNYRYCRDLQCGSADDSSTVGNLSVGREVKLENNRQLIEDRVEAWIWLDGEIESAVVPNLEIQPRGADFIAGIAFQDSYHPSWFFRLPKAAQDLRAIHTNWVILQPSWSYTHGSMPLQDIIPGKEIYEPDLTNSLVYLRSQGFETAIFPISHYPKPTELWWQEARRDFPWWVSWFANYRSFIQHHAQLAANTGASSLILGDPSIAPALPNGKLGDGTPSLVPEDTEVRWRAFIEEIRSTYQGKIWWAIDFPIKGTENQILEPPFLDAVDGIYVVWNSSLATEAGASIDSMSQKVSEQLDRFLLPLQQKINKPMILVINYPSAVGAATGCLPGLEGGCLDLTLLNQPNLDLQNISRDLKEQENIYNAFFLAVKDRVWIQGVVSNGYYFPIPLQDKSTSIHGKPARGVLWFWFGSFLGKFSQ